MYVRGKFSKNGEYRKLTFGLTSAQQMKLSRLTKGKFHFSDFYVTKKLSDKSLPNYGEPHARMYPPPVIIKELDPSQAEGWWQQELKVTEAWNYATGKGVTIADCDAGFYPEEEEIAPNLLMKFARDLSDKDAPTVIDDGYYQDHGTSVAAIMVGVLNGEGINGISPHAKVIPLQNSNYDSRVDDIDKEEGTAACILYALSIPQVNIIVLENQTHGSSETFSGTREAVRLALSAGVTIVSAAGNSGNRLTKEEEDDTGSIIVGAVDRDNNAEDWSNYGSRVSIAGYGSDLLTLKGPNGKLTTFGGTSGATPQVAATVALMLEINPNLKPEDIKKILIRTRFTHEKNKRVGGLINVTEALKEARQTKTFRDEKIKIFRQKLSLVLSSDK
jgi:subtilisin family serine protease